ncbi:MAG TPA: Nramp family divalent metal transporter [Burkholderiales bacterium]|nr:Nramp family divalent metal transporter [Burkholderiales bacterium]
MKKLLGVALGIVTSIGGFLDAGSIATSAQAGAAYGCSLLWALLLGTVCVIFLAEMSGRFSIVSGHTVTDAVRKRFGFAAFIMPFGATLLVNLLVLASELGGACVALQLVTGVRFQAWAIPVAALVWLLLWLGTFDVVENGTALLGLVTLCFVVAVFMLGADWREVGRGLVPALPPHERPHYLFLAVSIVGATIAPYLFLFYSSGAIEDKWDKRYLVPNRLIAVAGMSFGALIAMAVIVVAALTLQPQGIRVEHYGDAALMLLPAFGNAGFYLFVASLAVACLGAALELSLASAYSVAQAFGWNWGENLAPRQAARFAAMYTLFLAVAALVVLSGIEPMKLTLFSMAISAVVLPLAVLPFLVLMNDRRFMGEHVNGRLSNAVVVLSVGLAALIAVVAIPLEIFGSQ